MNFALQNTAIDPIHQFQVTKWLDLRLGNIDISFTNASGFMLLGVVLCIAFFGYAASKKALVPGRTQSMAEIGYGFVADMVRSTAGEEGLRFFPFVFTLFFFVFFANMIGMVPYAFTTTSHLVVTGALALLVIGIVIGFGIWKNGLSFFKLFAPSGAPWPIYFILVPIEVISFLARPVTLALRLFANMLAGHILLKVFAGFIIMLGSVGALGVLGAVAPLIMVVALTALEFLVAFLQAYVFTLLAALYFGEATHEAHH